MPSTQRRIVAPAAALGALGLVVAVTGFGGLYQAVTGHPASFQFAPAGVDWWTNAMDRLVVLVLATVFGVPHEWLHGPAYALVRSYRRARSPGHEAETVRET